MPLLRDDVQNDLCQSVITRITTGTAIPAPLLRVYDGATLIAECAIGSFSSPVTGFAYAPVTDATSVDGTPETYEIIGRANSLIMSGDIAEIPYTLISGVFNVVGGLRIISSAMQIHDDEIAFVTEGPTFQPRIWVTGNPTILWKFADGTTQSVANPTIVDYGSAGTRVTKLKVTPWSAVTHINLGYSGIDGGERYTPAATYGHPHQFVSEVINLYLVRNNLQWFSASYPIGTWGPMRAIDFGGFSQLRIVEFFYGALKAVNLRGCSNIIRVCFEECRLPALDLSDCPLLEDFRGSGNSFSASTLVWPSTPLALWHLCIQNNANLISLPNFGTYFPALEEILFENTGLSSDLGIANDNIINFIYGQNCDFTQSQVDNIFSALAAAGRTGTVCDLRGSAAPSASGFAAVDTMRANGWGYVHYTQPTVATPISDPSAGTYGTAQNVTLTCATVGAEIRYTIDGSQPTAGSTLYTGTAIAVTVTTRIRAIGILTGYNNSSEFDGIFTISSVVATPTFNPVAGTYVGTQSVSISCSTSNSTIYYRVDGGTYQQYTTALTVSSSQTIDAYATASGMTQSQTATAVYTINNMQTAVLGVNAAYGNYSPPAVGRKLCTRTNTVAAHSGTTIGIYFYVPPDTSPTNAFKLAVYDGSGNLRTGWHGEVVNATPGAWAFLPMSQTIVQGQTYRPCFISSGTNGSAYENTGEQDQGYSSVGYANEPSGNLSNLEYQDYTISMYIEYEY